MSGSKLAVVREGFADYEAQPETLAGHTHLERALGLAAEFLESDAPADEKQISFAIVRLHAERLKRSSAELLKDWHGASREHLALTFANMALFEAHDAGLSQEFFDLARSAELAVLLKKPFPKWDDEDYKALYRLLPSLNAKQ